MDRAKSWDNAEIRLWFTLLDIDFDYKLERDKQLCEAVSSLQHTRLNFAELFLQTHY